MDASAPEVINERLSRAMKARLADRSLQPLWRHLRDGLAQVIAEGILRPGASLPGERLLAVELGVSRVTLRRALDALREEGLLVSQQGSRTVVARRIEKAVSRLVGFSEDMLARGRQPGVRLINRHTAPATPAESAALDLAPGEEVVRIERVRLADGEAVALERAVVPRAILNRPEQVGDSLYEALDLVGMRPVRGSQRLQAVAASPADARHLGCPVGAPLLGIERRCDAADGTPVELTRTLYLGEAYDFLTDLVT